MKASIYGLLFGIDSRCPFTGVRGKRQILLTKTKLDNHTSTINHIRKAMLCLAYREMETGKYHQEFSCSLKGVSVDAD